MGVPVADESLSDTLLRFHNLEWLAIRAESITPGFVADITALPHLKFLSLNQHTSLGDLIAPVQLTSNLQMLSLHGATLTGAGVERVRQLPKLQTLILGDKWSSLGQAEELRDSFHIDEDYGNSRRLTRRQRPVSK